MLYQLSYSRAGSLWNRRVYGTRRPASSRAERDAERFGPPPLSSLATYSLMIFSRLAETFRVALRVSKMRPARRATRS